MYRSTVQTLSLSGSNAFAALASIARLFLLVVLVFGQRKDSTSTLGRIDAAFSEKSSEAEKPHVDFTKQVYEVLLESWKDPEGALEYFRTVADQEHDNKWLLEFANSSVYLMERVNEERQKLSGTVRQALDTLLSLVTNTEFLKASVTERREKALSVLSSFNLKATETQQLEEVRRQVLNEVDSLFSKETAADFHKIIL